MENSAGKICPIMSRVYAYGEGSTDLFYATCLKEACVFWISGKEYLVSLDNCAIVHFIPLFRLEGSNDL
jgi:hypothetical protein